MNRGRCGSADKDTGAALDSARPKAVPAAITGPSLARGRPDGLHER